ncbi:hypothetical protein ARMGADRAFT_331042 [Armillaria gallica]|uniref:ARM repeat-containing protein n=1 Tax=Armillaria gallica TaxID=47427 RepID=A0A2H3DQG8_ARMGA|nr:hypothetical protein ARMGADRAFT_331042 [Armillaria gallica]
MDSWSRTVGEKLKNYRSIFPEPRNRDEKHGFAATLLELLGQPETGFHAISLLQFMSAELHGVITSSDVYYKERLLDQLMSMIQDGHPKAKGTAVLCLSNYFKADSKFRRSTFHLEPELIVILINKLFDINSHCFPAQIEAVKTAFLAIVTHDDSVDKLADLKVINAIVKILCIEGWFDLEGGSGLLYRILSRDVKDSDITGVMVSVANTIIRELVLGSVSGDATCLQTQAFFVRLCHYEKLYTLMTANQDIIDTIIDAMNQPRRQAKAVTFLERIAKDGYACQLMLNISLLDKIAKLGKNIIRKKSPLSVQSVFGPAFTAVGKKTVVGDRGTLSAVRAALEVFASHEMFTQSLLDESVFQVITDGITTDVLKFREGHRVKAQIAGVRCLRELVKFEDARHVILSGEITNELIELLRTYNDEPDSSQWLRGWSDYGDLLEDTLKQLMKHEDAQEIVSDPRNLSLIRLMQFSPPQSNIHSWSERPRRLSAEQDSDRWSFSEGSICAI